MTASDLQRWSRDVAEDPGSASFLPLARAYRRQGMRDEAVAVVLRGLERNPEHVEAHALLALLHVDAGDRLRAGDEWETILRLDPANFAARRGLGFLALERGDLGKARAYLEAAAATRPDDATVAQALDVLDRREARRAADAVPAAPPAAGRPGEAPLDPARLFGTLEREAPFLGALLLDRRGLILAGSLAPAVKADGEALGALLTPAVSEAVRTSDLLRLGEWGGMTLECEEATLHLGPVGGAVVVVAVRPGAPAGWVIRTADRAHDLARSFLEGAA